MRIYFTIMYYEQWRPPIKGLPPAKRWHSLSKAMMLLTPPHPPIPPLMGIIIISPPRTHWRQQRHRRGGYAILVHKRFTSNITNALISALLPSSMSMSSTSTSSKSTSSGGACFGGVEWIDVTGYVGTGREKSSGPSKKHADNGDNDDDITLASGSGSHRVQDWDWNRIWYSLPHHQFPSYQS